MKRNSLILALSTATLMVGAFNRLAQAAPPTDPPFNLGWSFGANIPNAHQEGAGAVANNKFYVISGADLSCSDTDQGTPTTAVDIYDTVTNTFMAGPSVNFARDMYPIAADVGNSVYLIGGTASCYGPTVIQVEKLDLNTNTWTVLAAGSNLPAPLDGTWHCGAVHGDQIYYFQAGGIGVFDTTTDTWTVLPASPLLTPSDFCQATTLGNQIVVTGPGDLGYNQRILVFDVATGNMSLLTATTVPLSEHTAGLLFGSVVVAGGDYAGETSVQAISDIRCAACVSAGSTVSTLTALPDDSDDAVGGVIANKYYILGGHSSSSSTPPILVGTP